MEKFSKKILTIRKRWEPPKDFFAWLHIQCCSPNSVNFWIKYVFEMAIQHLLFLPSSLPKQSLKCICHIFQDKFPKFSLNFKTQHSSNFGEKMALDWLGGGWLKLDLGKLKLWHSVTHNYPNDSQKLTPPWQLWNDLTPKWDRFFFTERRPDLDPCCV